MTIEHSHEPKSFVDVTFPLPDAEETAELNPDAALLELCCNEIMNRAFANQAAGGDLIDPISRITVSEDIAPVTGRKIYSIMVEDHVVTRAIDTTS